MAKREIVGDTVKFDLPSGTSVEIQEINAEAEKVLTDRQNLKSGRWIVCCRIEMHKVADQNVTMLQTEKVINLQT